MSTSETEAPDYSGRVIAGRIRLNECIGGGGMGWVYSAHHLTLDKPIAVKVLRRTRDPAHAARFVREARSTSRLDHPNIVSILDFGEDGDDRLLYLAMEEIVGTTLATVLQRGPLPEAKAVDLMLQVLSALIHAHRAGIVHRDLKPANVMIVQRENDDEQVVDVVKVLDFGLVKLLGDEEAEGGALTRKGVTVGTPEYMSPEQCVGGTVDARTDVYACGAILYEMLCGRPPFQGPDTGQIIMLHLNTRPDPIASLVPGIDPELASVVNWTLEKRANSRCPSAVELRRALSRTLSDSDPFDVRTVIDASSFRRVVSESSSLEIPEAELLAASDMVRPVVDPSTPPSLEMVTELTRPVDEQEALGVVIASPTPLDLTEPTSGDDLPFWMWSQAGQLVGPMSYFALARALGGLVAEGQADRAYVSVDARTWKSVFEFAQMTQQEGTLSRGPPEALHEVDQDVLSVFARVAIDRPTGSIVVEADDDWAEIEIVAGAPTHVRSNDPLLQLPHLLVDRGFLKRDMLMRVIHESLRRDMSIEKVLEPLVDVALLERAVVREQISRMFTWGNANAYVDERRETRPKRPVVESVLEGIVSLVALGVPLNRLRERVAKHWTAFLEPGEHHDAIIAAMHLLPGETAIAESLDGTKSPADVMDGTPGFGKSHMALIYTLIRTGALKG